VVGDKSGHIRREVSEPPQSASSMDVAASDPAAMSAPGAWLASSSSDAGASEGIPEVARLVWAGVHPDGASRFLVGVTC
jgi:hypothetical protein